MLTSCIVAVSKQALASCWFYFVTNPIAALHFGYPQRNNFICPSACIFHIQPASSNVPVYWREILVVHTVTGMKSQRKSSKNKGFFPLIMLRIGKEANKC